MGSTGTLWLGCKGEPCLHYWRWEYRGLDVGFNVKSFWAALAVGPAKLAPCWTQEESPNTAILLQDHNKKKCTVKGNDLKCVVFLQINNLTEPFFIVISVNTFCALH